MLLKFASLLLVTMFAVDNRGTLFPPKKTEVQQNLIPGSRVTTRLDVYKSLAKLDHQPRGNFLPSIRSHQDILVQEDDETVNESLQHSLVELREIIEGLRTSVIPNESGESLIVFQSLLKMLSNPQQSASSTFDSLLPWQKYVDQSIRDLKCSVRNLCREFGSNFKCDPEGHLRVILLNEKSPFDHLNLLMIPNTVEMLSMGRCGLTSISAWSDLKGKSLKWMRIYERGTSLLTLNLDGLRGTLDSSPLKHITILRSQISGYFGLQAVSLQDSALPRIGHWMRSSTLVSLCIESKAKQKRKLFFGRNGVWKLE